MGSYVFYIIPPSGNVIKVDTRVHAERGQPEALVIFNALMRDLKGTGFYVECWLNGRLIERAIA